MNTYNLPHVTLPLVNCIYFPLDFSQAHVRNVARGGIQGTSIIAY